VTRSLTGKHLGPGRTYTYRIDDTAANLRVVPVRSLVAKISIDAIASTTSRRNRAQPRGFHGRGPAVTALVLELLGKRLGRLEINNKLKS
jgi:hypothetical protein